ncbi:unnamed protein product [Adineta steineri]|uniref:Uncharacterized protein n=1 Tax=Adineta steineri TaxID=433720 RepID=A0A814P1F6_9BILA|nr:unnamed protein product [Adineta steineri]CAF1153056.1 unnamed protein product [Adineta steineri]
MPILNSDLNSITKTLFELNNHLNQILAENKQEINDENEELYLGHIKETICTNLVSLNNELNSLQLNDIDDQSIPTFRSTLDQLKSLVDKIQSITTDDNIILAPHFSSYAEQLNRQSSAVPETHEHLQSSPPIFRVDQCFFGRKLNLNNEIEIHSQSSFKIQLSENLQFLNKKLDRLETIYYKRHQRKLHELFIKIQSKYEHDRERCKQRITFQCALKQYSKNWLNFYEPSQQSKKELTKQLRTSYRQNFRNDLQFRHFFHMFLCQFRKDLFQMVLNESKDYLPRSNTLINCLEDDEYYNLYSDEEQLTLIYQFVRETFYAKCLEELYNVVPIKTPYFKLFFTYIDNTDHASNYVNLLKESYLVYVRDSILPLTEQNRESIESNKTIQSIYDQLKLFNEDSFKIIHDSERLIKTCFIRQFKGKTWNEKLICDQCKLNDQNTTNSNEDFESEDCLISIGGLVEKSESLFEQSKTYKEKKPSLKLYLKKSMDLLNESMSIDEFIIKSHNSTPDDIRQATIQLSNKFQFRALIYLDMAKMFNFCYFEKFNCFNQSKHDFIQYENQTENQKNVQFHKNNFINLFKKAFATDNTSSMKSYDDILQINPYFFEAQYQKLLKFYELNNCEKGFHLHKTFSKLTEAIRPIQDLFEILIHLQRCVAEKKNDKSSIFCNKILEVKVTNNQNKSLYLHFSIIENEYQIKFNDQEQLINLLKYGQQSIIKIKNNSTKSSTLKYHLSNFDFKQLLRSLLDKITNQESNFLKLIQLFKKLESVNEKEYKKLDENFQKLLPETRFNLIQCKADSDHFQSVCEISRSVKEFRTFLNLEKSRFNQINRRILQLKFQRANIYRKNHYFYLEILELLDILKYQKTNADYNPVIYYRLSYLYRWKGNLQISIHYINLASKKYNEKINKKIFRKVEKFKSNLLKLENIKNNEVAFIDKNKMRLSHIFNLITKSHFKLHQFETLGFYLFKDTSANALLNCLFYHLIEEDDVEEYLKWHDNTLTKTYRELQEESVSEGKFINKFNEKFKTNFKCFFVEDGIDNRMFSYTNIQVPIVLVKTTNSYTTIKEVNYFMFLTVLLTTYDAKADLKTVCSKFLDNEISKNILSNTNENKNIEIFIESMIASKSLKIFNEEVIYYLKFDDYNPDFFHFWSLIANLDDNIDLTDALNDFKELFIESIEEYREEKEEEHKSALQLIDDMIEQNAKTEKNWNLLNKLKKEIIQSLSEYEKVSPKFEKRKKLDDIISSEDGIDKKFRQIISQDCFSIDLKFGNLDEEQYFYQYLKTSDENQIPFQLLQIIHDSLLEPKININSSEIIMKNYNIFLSDIIENVQTKIKKKDFNIQTVIFYGTNVFMNLSLNDECWRGINLIIGSDIIDFIKDESNTKITIDLTGKNGADGKNAKEQLHAKRESEDGLDGLPGENGESGGNGGNIYFIAEKQFKGQNNIEKLITSGGNGGKGGNGGNGGNGQNGKDGQDATGANSIGYFKYGYCFTQGGKGTPGGDGGKGGDAGLGGFGGHAGTVHIEENQNSIISTFSKLIESLDKSNENGKDGLPGQGGKGGNGGSDGNDLVWHRPKGFSKDKAYTGYIEKVEITKNTFFRFDLNVIYKERPKKSDGIEKGQGKTADIQLNTGKVRQKSENKEKSNEQQIKNQLNEVVNNNDERTNNISNNVANSINLLKDKKNEMLDERETHVKTHQLSDSLLANAYTIAQQSLALNATITKSKTENNILKTSDTNNNQDNKLASQLKLSIDTDSQQSVQFQIHDAIVQKLEHYKSKKLVLKSELGKKIKQTDEAILSLKHKGKHVLFKIDIDSSKNSFLIDQNERNQINLSRLDGSLLTTTDDLFFNEDFSLLTKTYESVCYNRISKRHEPFVLKQYFHDLDKLKQERKAFIRARNKLDQLDIDVFINEICLEYGNKDLIKYKLTKFDEIVDFDSFNIDNFIKQNDFPIDEKIMYQNYLTNLFSNQPNNPKTIEEISQILIESKISIKRIKESKKFLFLLFDVLKGKNKFKEFKLIQCTPIYHSKEPIDVYIIEQLIYQFLQINDKNLELLARIFNCFRKIIEKGEHQILCEKKIKNFLQFITEHLLVIGIDSSQGSLLYKMKRDLNFIQIHCSSKLFYDLFNGLELTILIREQQFEKLKKYTDQIEMYFQEKQTNDIDQDIKIVNHIKKDRKFDIHQLFQQHITSTDVDFNGNTNIRTFIDNLYLPDEFKSKIKIIFTNFYNYLKNIEEYKYDCLRLQKLSEINQNQTSTEIINLSESDYNKNIGYIYLLSRQLNSEDKIQIKNGNKIIIQKKNENQFRIYFRDNQTFEFQKHSLDEESLIEILNKLNFGKEEMILLKENENHTIYQSVYKKIVSENGFTKYSIEQIESFTRLKEIVYEKLSVLKDELDSKIYKCIVDEIKLVFHSESPDIWLCRIHFIFNNIDVITNLENKFKLSTSTEFKKSDLKDLLNNLTLKDNAKHFLEDDEDDRRIIFYKFLSIFDRLLIQIAKKELDIPVKVQFDATADILSEKYQQKDDLRNTILYEVIVKNNQILKQYYPNEILIIYEKIRTQISNSVNFSCSDLDTKELAENIQTHFKYVIDNGYLSLSDYIDKIYVTSSHRLNTSMKYKIYSNLMEIIDNFYKQTVPDSQMEAFIEKSTLFFKHLQKQCLILISGLDNINHPSQTEIKDILAELKTKNTTFEKCSLRILPRDRLDTTDQNQIILSKISEQEYQIVYRRLQDNKTNSFIFKQDENEKLFELFNCLNNDDLIEEQMELQKYEELYSIIKTNNGSIYKNVFFDEKIFIEIFINCIMKNRASLSVEIFRDYMNSFEIILKNSTINCDILLSLNESFRNLTKNEPNEEYIQIFNQLINEKNKDLMINIETKFEDMYINIKRKNRILNITFNYLTKCLKEKTIESISFEKNQLLNITLSIKSIFQAHQLKLSDILQCCEELNRALTFTPYNCLEMYKKQSDCLKLKIRLFIEKIDFPQDCKLKTHFDEFNNKLQETEFINNQSIFKLLDVVLLNSKSIESENYQSIMKKILLNFEMTADPYDWDMLEKIETTITKVEKIDSIQISFRKFILETVKTKLNLKYKEEMNKYEQRKKSLNNSIQEIIKLFWSNISNSDLLNKEREKAYVNVNIEKLLKLFNDDKDKQELFLTNILSKLKELQSNSDKKQFTNKFHMYLNEQINTELNQTSKIIIPIELDKDLQNSLQDILENNYAYKDSIIIFDEFSILFETCIDKFKNEPKYNEFFESFKNRFMYFSWRLLQYDSTTKQDSLNKAIDRFTASIKKFKHTIHNENIEQASIKYKYFYEFENIFSLRTHENQLQEELNILQADHQEKHDKIEQIIKICLNRVDNCLSRTDQPIATLGQSFYNKINELFSKNSIELKDFEPKEISEAVNETTDNKSKPDVVQEQIEVPIEKHNISNVEIPLEAKFEILNKLSCQIINEEKKWTKRKVLIEKFDAIRDNLFNEDLQSMYEQRPDKSQTFDAFKNSIEVKNLKEIITQTDASEWNQEIYDLSIDLFIMNLLKLYDFDLNTLKGQFKSIENLITIKSTDDVDDILSNIWQTEIKEKKDSMDIIDFIMKYSTENVESLNSETMLNNLMTEFIKKLNSIKMLKSSIDTLYFFVGYENFIQLVRILQLKLIGLNSPKIDVDKLTQVFCLLSSVNNLNRSFKYLESFHIENWLVYLYFDKIEDDLNILFHRYFDEFNVKDLKIIDFNHLDELIETKYYQIENSYKNTLNDILETLKMIKINPNINVNEKEAFFHFIARLFFYELKKASNCLINLNDLQTIFIKYLTSASILNKLIRSLQTQLSKSDNQNDQLVIENIYSKTFNSLLPYLTRFWIIEQLELNRKVSENEQIKIIQYFEMIKTSYSEEKMFQLIDVIQKSCKNEKLIPQIIIDLLMNISNNEWLLNNDILDILQTTKTNEWEKKIENYMEEKRFIKRDFHELINLMKEDKNNLNKSIKDYLNSTDILSDLQLLTNRISVENWTIADIQEWAEKTRGNRLLLSKEAVQNAIVVVSQAIQLFKGFYPRDTQILALWLFLNPDFNQTNIGCLAQISTGEGKSIIVAALAAIKALGRHRIDVITSSSVLAIRDAAEFQRFFDMFGLHVSNNCDSFCEQGNGKETAEQIRKSRYYNSNGPVDIIYGECSCFERDILLTEFNKNDPEQNIIGQRISKNSISSVIIDEVDSMLLDKANMVLYLSHNIDTLKSLERIFISIWQTINQPAFDYARNEMINDDLIKVVSDIIFEQIDQKNIEIPEYNSYNCNYINIRLFIKRRMLVWIRSAFHVRDMIPNDTYIISRDKSSKSEVQITVMDKDTGTEQLSTRWSNGVHQFLQLKHMRRFTPESLKAVFISNMSFFKRYKKHIIGLTGSLGSIDEQSLLDKVYQLRFFELPRFKLELFRELKGTITTSQDTWLENIKNALDREIKSKLGSKDRRRAVLIICENVKNVLILKEYLTSSYPNTKDYKSAYEDFKIDQLTPGDIIIATNLAGRGTDLETSDKLEENGGLHVIATYLPTNIRIEMQAFGRTARKGNKGTGEYIIISQYGLSIETLKQLRNFQEKERLDSFLINDLPKIQTEEDLLQGFTDDDQLSCIGFTKLYQNIEKKLLSDANIQRYGYQYKQFQLNSLKNRWAFWLDSMTEHINMINIIGKKKIVEKFNEFQLNIEKDIEADPFRKLIIEPSEFIKLGKYYRDQENWSNAILCYKEASQDRFYSFSNYYTSSCIQNKNYADDPESKSKFKHSLLNVQQSIEKELQFLNNAAQIAFEIGEKNRILGLPNYGNEYDKQVKEKSTIWNIFSGTVINALGSPIDPKDLTGNKYLSDEGKARILFNILKCKEYIKPSRITKKEIKPLDLPSMFNNDETKNALRNYLVEKSKRRKEDDDLDELNEEIFKKEIKKEKIFIPYFQTFVDKIKNYGFITPVTNTSENQLYLLQNFNEENLKNKNFPNEISRIKQILFDWATDAAKERTLLGTKTHILEKINDFLKLKSEANITTTHLNQFYQFLETNSLLEKVIQYTVSREKIINPVDGEYKYFNLYDFERNYTNEFENFDSVLRKSFLRIIVIQEHLDKGDSYITLKEIINTNDFYLHKTEDEAINYLWNYLKSVSLIKSPRINIGFSKSVPLTKSPRIVIDLIGLGKVDVRTEIKKEIESFLKRELPEDKQNELNEAVNTVFNIIDQTIGDLKKIPDDKTITSYLQIKTSCFLENKKRVPEALEEFIDLAFDVIFRLEEKKEPPQWYEIAAVIALGIIQVAAGVLAKAFMPVYGQLIGEFLISTGCDDILFGINCAISDEFNWEKYWQHKKQSMITSAITAVVFVSVSYLKNAERLKSVKEARAFQQLTGAQKLHNAATALKTTANIGKYVGKEIAKTLIQTGLAELASRGVDKMLDVLSNTYESELREKITNSLKNQWNIIETEMLEIFRVTEGKDSMKIIDDCINRKLQNLSEDGTLKNLTRRCTPVIQGLGKALADVKGTKGTIISFLMTRAPKLIGLGVSIKDIVFIISSFVKSLVNDLKDAQKAWDKTNKQYELTDAQKNDFQKFQKDKRDQVSNCLTENFNQKLKHGILAPVLNHASNMMISKGIEFIAGTDRIEQLADTFELIHAATNPGQSKVQYEDALAIFIAEARPIDMKLVDKDRCPVNGDGKNLQKLYELHGDSIKIFIDKNGEYYVRKPSSKEYYQSIRGDKPAGLHEQSVIPGILGVIIKHGEVVNNEQQCTLEREDGSKIEFVIKHNFDGTKHAELIVDGKSVSINTSNQNKNDCYYNVVLVANEMSKHKSFDEAKKILDNSDAVKVLRKDVSLSIKNNKKLLNEFRWTNGTDIQVHYNNLVGLSRGRDDLERLLASVENMVGNEVNDIEKMKNMINDYIKRRVNEDAKSKKEDKSGQGSRRGEHIFDAGLKNIGEDIEEKFLKKVGMSSTKELSEDLRKVLNTFNVTLKPDISEMTAFNVPQYGNENAFKFGRSKELLIEFSVRYMKNLYDQNDEPQANDTTANEAVKLNRELSPSNDT